MVLDCTWWQLLNARLTEEIENIWGVPQLRHTRMMKLILSIWTGETVAIGTHCKMIRTKTTHVTQLPQKAHQTLNHWDVPQGLSPGQNDMLRHSFWTTYEGKDVTYVTFCSTYSVTVTMHTLVCTTCCFIITIVANCPEISGTVLKFWPMSRRFLLMSRNFHRSWLGVRMMASVVQRKF